VSAATIRNDMALLEEEELIAAPHTSSGRIPTDKGYRVFVDQLTDVRPLTRAQRQAIETFLGESSDLDELLARTVRLIAQLTKQLAVVQYPSFGSARVRHVELVSLAPARVLCILIADSGQVEQRLAELEQPVDEETLAGLRVRLNEIAGGRTMADAAVALSGEIPSTDRRHAAVLHTLAVTLAEQARAQRTDRLVVAGAANLVRTEQDFAGSILDVIEAIEEQVVLLKLFGEMAGDEHAVAVRIGRENAPFGLGETSIVSSAFAIPGRDISRLGVVGPTRMDYSNSMAAVRAVARYLSRTLGES
jgi:heat-inducible transcriptional repressor